VRQGGFRGEYSRFVHQKRNSDGGATHLSGNRRTEGIKERGGGGFFFTLWDQKGKKKVETWTTSKKGGTRLSKKEGP